MKLAIMQPYFLPYLGYFQLMAATEKFVVYDDVHFIKGGWINRNRILLHDQPHFITVPLQSASSNRRINEIRLAPHRKWREKMLKTLAQAYRAAPHFDSTYPLLRRVIEFPTEELADFLFHSLVRLKSYLNLPTDLVASSNRYDNEKLKGHERVLDICRQEKADVYVNAPGGRELYDAATFADHAVQLRFLASEAVARERSARRFDPSLSIVDALMFNSQPEIESLLGRYTLSA